MYEYFNSIVNKFNKLYIYKIVVDVIVISKICELVKVMNMLQRGLLEL